MKPKLKRDSVKARALNFDGEAWFYENAKSIDVYTYCQGVGSYSCRISRAKIADWLKRTALK